MNALEKIVTSLEMSRKIQEAGIDFGETAFSWGESEAIDGVWGLDLTKNIEGSLYGKEIIPAYTEGDMIDWLPHEIITYIDIFKEKHFATLYLTKKLNNLYACGYMSKEGSCFTDKSPKEALAKLCLWCKDNGYV